MGTTAAVKSMIWWAAQSAPSVPAADALQSGKRAAGTTTAGAGPGKSACKIF